MLNKLYHKGAEIKSAFLNGVMVFGSSDVGLAKDYSGTGWYKATDTGVVYNVGVPEGETHIFAGDSIEYISVWRNEGFDISAFEGTEEDIQKLVYWHSNLHRFATSNVTDMSAWMYVYGSSDVYEQLDISPDDINTDVLSLAHYDTSNVTNMDFMFYNAAFNLPIDNFDTSNVTSMSNMFAASSYNQPLDSLDTSKVTTMEGMFNDATLFNQPLDNFNTANVINMEDMFSGASTFNQDISSWNTIKVTNMDYMFTDATSFNQNLSRWCVPNITSKPTDFARRTEDSWTLPKPVWGTCPRGENTPD